MKSQVNRSLRSFVAVFLAGTFVAAALAQEDFDALVKRTQSEKPKFAKRHEDLLEIAV